MKWYKVHIANYSRCHLLIIVVVMYVSILIECNSEQEKGDLLIDPFNSILEISS